MRVAVKDADDVAEFLLINEFWIAEGGEPVTLEFPTAVFEAIGIMPDQHNLKQPSSLLWEDEFNPGTEPN